jgi:hypothetical protein
MKSAFLFLLLLLSLNAVSQNGGQFFENSVIRINYIGYSDGSHIFKVCSKQNCEARIRTKAERDPAVDIIVQALSCETVRVARPTNINILFRAKAETFCISNPDMGWLELNTSLLTLPLIETNYVFIDRGPNKLEISIKAGKFKRVFSLSGKKLYENKSIIEKTSSIDISPYLETGINLVEVIIETRRFDRFVFKYFKQQN